MPAETRLLTGPHGAALLERAIARPEGLWLVPTRLAQARLTAELARATAGWSRPPRVWCWEDLWQGILEVSDEGPMVLSGPSGRAVLIEALDRAERDGRLEVLALVAGLPGFRRRLARRVSTWQRQEWSPDPEAGPSGPVEAEEWAVLDEYRRLLGELGAVDAEGLAVWASRELPRSTPRELRRTGSLPITVVGPDESPACRRVVRWLEESARSVRVVLSGDDDPARAEVFGSIGWQPQRLRERGYVEETVGTGMYRPAGLRALEGRLFRPDAHTLPPLTDTNGLGIIGAPAGEGQARVLAREVKRRLDEGAAPDDLLVLVRRWDDEAEIALGALRAWGLPVSATGRSGRAAADPAVAVVGRLLDVPASGWEATQLVRLLRSGRFRPDWPEAARPDLPALAASALQASSVHRGRDLVLRLLDQAIDEAGDDRQARDQAIAIADLVRRLVRELGPLDQPGPRRLHLDRLRRVVASLGLDRGGASEALEAFWLALEDHAGTLDTLTGDESLGLAQFEAEVAELAGDLRLPGDPHRAGTIVMTTVDEAAGTRSRHVFLVNLTEGSFPTRDAIDLSVRPRTDDDEGGETPADDAPSPAYAREMDRFLRVLGMADEGLTLTYPVRDEKGQELLLAGFLDEALSAFHPDVLAGMHDRLTQLDPVLLDRPDLARAPGDARVRAVALACLRHDDRPLRALAASPVHRDPLLGAATALGLQHQRLRRPVFTPFDGALADPRALIGLAAWFGPTVPFSASQLETYLDCPFQFFMKYVLRLRPVEERDELDEDYLRRGNQVHEVLDRIERAARDEGADRLELAERFIAEACRAEAAFDSELGAALEAIERRRLERTIRDYVSQAREYEQRDGGHPVPRYFEQKFGEDGVPCVVVGEGESAVLFRGKIDRVDFLTSGEVLAFRVIDYKTGACPKKPEVENAFALQLPIYALAVEQLLLGDEASELRDLGYWELRDKGYKALEVDWPALRARVEARVLEAVGRLRRGRFVVDPRRDDCTRHCDYAAVCRITQMRRVAKRGAEGGEAP